MFVAMWTYYRKGSKEKAKRDQEIQTSSKAIPFVTINQQVTGVPLPLNITIIDKKVQPNKHVHSPSN
jgi:hypothetical protein